jgi:hypothetical protein
MIGEVDRDVGTGKTGPRSGHGWNSRAIAGEMHNSIVNIHRGMTLRASMIADELRYEANGK